MGGSVSICNHELEKRSCFKFPNAIFQGNGSAIQSFMQSAHTLMITVCYTFYVKYNYVQ